VVVQKGLAHAHENDIYALYRRLHALIAKHRGDLSHDFSRRQITFYSQERGETETAVSRAPYLARDAKCVPSPSGCRPRLLITSFATIAGLSVVSFGHPDSLYRIVVGELHKISNGAVTGHKLSRDRGQSDSPASLLKLNPIVAREGRDPFQGLNPLA